MKRKFFVAAILILSASILSAHTRFPFNTAPKEKFIQLSTGVKLEYVEQGDPSGIPVIFLHGLSDSWHSFESSLPYLPRSIHAFAISQRGHGDSERPVDGYTPKHFAADVAAFIQQKNLSAAVIVGHSMGGVNAQQFAISYPQLTRGLVIIDSDPSLKSNPGMPEFQREIQSMEGSFSREFMDGFQKGTLAKPIDSAYYALLVNEAMKLPLFVLKSAVKGFMDVDYSEALKGIRTPALIFWGDKDAICLRKGQDILTSNLKGAKLLIYEGTGHALHWEEPQRFAKDLTHFIETNINASTANRNNSLHLPVYNSVKI